MAAPSQRLDELLRRATPQSGKPAAAVDAAALLAAVEEILAKGESETVPRALWEDYLAVTRHPDFLTALAHDAARDRWAATTFTIIETIGYTLGDLLERRAVDQPEQVLFQELGETGSGRWTYAQIRQRVRATAAVFLKEGPAPDLAPTGPRDGDGPRVALLCDNSVGSACCDLACLTHDIFVTPLNVHFNLENLVWIFDRLRITVAVCDHPDKLDTLLAIRDRAEHPFVIFTLHYCGRVDSQDIRMLDESRGLLDTEEIATLLTERPRRRIRETATVMFTSGSTGMPKGVAFNQFNLVSKRFARAAALPEVGRDEVMLCYLPLYHTFGRYLEMLGAIFWGGTYIFAGNPSAATLFNQFREVRPTGFISVPIRWVQIRDRVMELAQDPDAPSDPCVILREVVGDRLFWGLSAAGYLDPKVFRFFHRCGVSLCSGFGMTEGTGGLTMTPPDQYVENSVGIPLPGVKVRFAEQGELQIAGPYIARYLPDEADPGSLAVEDPGLGRLLARHRDLFRQNRRRPPGDRRPDQGHLQEQPGSDHRPAGRGVGFRAGARHQADLPGRRRTQLQHTAHRP